MRMYRDISGYVRIYNYVGLYTGLLQVLFVSHV